MAHCWHSKSIYRMNKLLHWGENFKYSFKVICLKDKRIFSGCKQQKMNLLVGLVNKYIEKMKKYIIC